MYFSYKNSTKQLLACHNDWWRVLRNSKGLNTSEFRTWEATLDKDSDENIIYPSEDFTIIEDENFLERFSQLSENGYVYHSPDTGVVYNIKYYASKRDAEEILDIDGKSHDPKQYVQSHFVGDDTAKDAQLLAAEWVSIRRERDRLIAETDWMMLSDTGTVSAAWKNYRKALREIPQSQDSVKKFEDIDWPDKPSS